MEEGPVDPACWCKHMQNIFIRNLGTKSTQSGDVNICTHILHNLENWGYSTTSFCLGWTFSNGFQGRNKCPISLFAIQMLLHPEKNQVLTAEMLEDFQFCFLQNRHKSTVDGVFWPLPPCSHQPPTGVFRFSQDCGHYRNEFRSSAKLPRKPCFVQVGNNRSG